MANREMWEIEVRHNGLNKYRHIRGSDRYIVEQKASVQKLAWDEMWEKKLIAEQKKNDREAAIKNKEEKKELAITKTNEAQEAIKQLETIILHTLEVDDAIDWDSLLDTNEYPESEPSKPTFANLPPEPNQSDTKYQPDISFFNKLFSKSRIRKEDEAERKFIADHKDWINKKSDIEQKNRKIESDHEMSVKDWETNKAQI